MNITVFSGAGLVEVHEGAPSETPVLPPAAGQLFVYASGCTGVEIRPAASVPVVEVQQIGAHPTVVGKWHTSGHYERSRPLEVWQGNTATVRIAGFNGNAYPLQSQAYTLLANGAPIATVAVTAGATSATFSFGIAAVPEGWVSLELGGLASGETCPKWWVYRMTGAAAVPQPMHPVVRGTYEITQKADGKAMHALVPSRYLPTPKPIGMRARTPFADAKRPQNLHCRQLVPMRFGDEYRTNLSRSGILSAMYAQAYHWSDFVALLPRVPQLDGPRGVGTLCMTTHIEPGQRNDTLYVLSSWRVCRVRPDGEITTLAGYRHRDIARHWADAPVVGPAVGDLELVGDWSEIPVERRGFHELWGMAWDERTIVRGGGQSVVNDMTGELEPAHDSGPVMFVADSQRNRVCRLEFSATDHSTPAKVTEFLTGLGDPWDVQCRAGVLYVSERTSHRIAAYDATTGALLRVVVQGAALAVVNANRNVVRLASLSACQAALCVAPEGLFLQDDWLYFGSMAQGQCKRVHLVSGALELACTFGLDNNFAFAKIAVSDGTFGPKGTVFCAAWTNTQIGAPQTKLPDGMTYAGSGTRTWSWYELPSTGPSGQWAHFVYPTAVACRDGRLIWGGVNEGLLEATAKVAGDIEASALVKSGATEWTARGLHMVYGQHGFGFYGLPLPWGTSPAIDAYLQFHGHEVTNNG